MIKKLFFAVTLLISINYSFAAIDALAAGDPPVLSNFRIENSNPNRVYFDSSEPITVSSTTGFIISGKTITNVVVNSGQSTGHYFTVSNPFTFWDNNTIRYEGGSNLADADSNPLYAFTLEYIKNYIDEPAATSNTLYVATNGSDSNSGTSIDSPYLTIQKALSMARAGTTIYVRAGLYRVSNWVSMPSVGTSTSPLKIIGYKSTPGDINSNYYNYVYGSIAPDLDDSEMPVFERLSSSTGIFTAERGDDYIIFKNIQAREASSFVRSIYASNIIVENSNFKEAGDGGGDGSGIELIGSTTGEEYDISNYRIKNCVVINSGMANLDIKGNHNLIENVRTYCDNTRDAYSADGVSDYYINISGSNNIVRNSKAQRRNGVATAASGHGIGVKAGERSGFKHSYYNLFEKNYVIACNEGYYTRNTYADYNVFKDCEVDGLGVGVGTSYGVNGNGMVFYTDSKYNVAERMYIHDTKAAIVFDNNHYEVLSESDNIENMIKNSIITNCYWAIKYSSDGSNNSPTLKNNKIYNNTFDNVVDFYYQDGTFSSISGNEFKNNILNSVGKTESLSGWTFDHNDFYNSSALGSNVLNENPQMDTNFMPSNEALKSGIPLTSVVFDKDRVKRNATNPTIGALEIAAPTVGSVSPNTTICSGENATLVASGGTSYLWNSGETTDSITVSPTETTTYIVTVSDDQGNSDSHEVTVTVDQPPSVNLGDDLTICSGEEVTLTATGEGDFTWSTGETTPSITVSPTETTTYTVTASNSCAADATDELVITVNESPSLTTTGDVTICEGESVDLTATSNGSLSWNTGETTPTITVSPTETTTYTVTSTLGACPVSEDIVVTVNPAPSVTASDDVTICSGEEVTLTATGTGNFTWNTGETSPSITVSPTETTTYTVTAGNSCASDVTDEVIVTVNESPSLTTSGDVTICEGQSIDLTATSNGNVEWNTGETMPTITVSPTETTTYTVTSTLGACPVSQDIVVTVNQTPSVTASDDLTICSGEEVILTATGKG
ncbi:MAG: hypothetical protein KDC69_02420, partial [Flavobacteriaceae bacterium]|nr:hypothetical protein [Flavobacteriaceae bacterium]